MVVPLLAPLILIAALLVAYAQATLAHSQNTGLIGWLTGKLSSLPIIGGLSVKQVLKLDGWITNMLGRHFKQIEARGVAWMVSLDSFTRRNAKAALSVAAPVWALAYWLVHTEIGRQAKAHDAPIAKTADHALAVATDARDRAIGHKTTPVQRTTTTKVTKVERVVMPHAEEWDWITHHWGGLVRAISLAAAGALAPTLPQAKPIRWPWGLTPTAIRRRLHRLEGLLGVAGMAVAVAAVFRVTPRCVTNGNIGKLMRRICGMPAHWFNDLLGLLADFYVLENLCDVLPWVEAAASSIAVPFVEGVTTITKANGGCLSKTAPAYPVPQLYLPSVTPGLLVGV